MKTTVLCEAIDLREAVVDADARTVDVVLIRPGWSLNGKYYSPDVLARSVGLFEGVKAYADHPSREALRRGEGRSVRDVTGIYTDVRLGEDGALRATRKVYRTPAGDAVWPLVLESIGAEQPVIGLSINAVGRAKHGAMDGREGWIVEAITAAHSVDDVTEPAAGGGFMALTAGHDDLVTDLLGALDYEEYIAARPEFVERLKREWKAVRQDDAVAAAYTERDQARAALVEAQHAVQDLQATVAAKEADLARLRADLARKGLEVELERALRHANLPHEWEHDIREQLDGAPTTEWLAILEREQRKARAAGARHKPVPVQGAPQRVGGHPPAFGGPGPLDMDQIQTPEQLQAVIRILQQGG